MVTARPPLWSLEITPPARPNADVLLRRARALDPLFDVVNVIDRSDRIPSLDAAGLLADAGIATSWNLRTRGRTRADIDRDLACAAERALDRLVCLRGERGTPDLPDTPPLHETIRRARALLPRAEIGATLNPYAAGDRLLKNLFGKLEAGASFVQTNLVFRRSDLDPLAEQICTAFPDVQIFVMVRPFADRDEAERVASRVGASDAANADLAPIPTGTDAFGALVREIGRSPLYGGITLMTPRMDVDPMLAQELRRVLARPDPGPEPDRSR